MLPSVYFLWLGLNTVLPNEGPRRRWPFVVSGIFLGGLVYIYLSGVFAPPFYAAFFCGPMAGGQTGQQIRRASRAPPSLPDHSILEPVCHGADRHPADPADGLRFADPAGSEPGTTRVSQAFFLNPQISQGDPWGLLWRSFVGNFGAYGVSLSWLAGETPRLVLPTAIGLFVFLVF